MRMEHADPHAPKGWYVGPWNAHLTIAVGYANAAIDDPHLHTTVTEIYLVARGWSDVRVEHQTVRLVAGDMLIVEPGEAHTFLGSSPDYLHFVLHIPGPATNELRADRVSVHRSRLELDR